MRKGVKFGVPYPSTRKDKKLMVYMMNPRTGRIVKIHFGQKGYKNNSTKKSWERYMKRSSGIRDKNGRRTKKNKMRANYWSRKILWNGRKWRK